MSPDGTFSPRLGRSAAVFAATVFFTSTFSFGQARPPRNPPRNDPPARPQPATPRNDSRGFPAKPVIEADLGALDDELAQYIQFRGEVAAAEATRLELLIDLRVLSRWCLAAAASAGSESDLQVNAYLRGLESLATARALAEHFKTQDHPNAAQNAAMAKIHALTFTLAELKSAKQADDLFRDVGAQLVIAAGALPPDVKQITLMRPPSPQAPPTTGPTKPPPVEIDPVSRAKLLSVSAPLKKEVTVLAEASNAARADLAAADARKREDASALIATTRRVLDMAEGMSLNSALDAQSRPKLEQQLADGVALYTDPRMRKVGEKRISALDTYAQTLTRMRKLTLKPEVQKALAPLFAYAAEHSDQGSKLMSTVESYLAACGRMDARPAVAGLGLREAKAVADALKVCTAERDAFLADANGSSYDTASYSRHVDAMTKSLDSADLYERIPKSAQALIATYKPKPTGGLERRIATGWQTLSDPKATSTARDEVNRLFVEVAKLSDQASSIEAAGQVAPEINKVYARGKLAAFDAKRRELLVDALSTLAAGKDMDTARTQRLDQMRSLRDALGDTPLLEMTLKRADVLSRWADWPVEPAELQGVFNHYRETMALLIDSYASTESPPAVQWGPVQTRYKPLIRLMVRLSGYADYCNALPAGWPGNLGRLVTPLEGQPFAAERYAAYCIKLWVRYESAGDSTSAGTVADTLAARLRR